MTKYNSVILHSFIDYLSGFVRFQLIFTVTPVMFVFVDEG